MTTRKLGINLPGGTTSPRHTLIQQGANAYLEGNEFEREEGGIERSDGRTEAEAESTKSWWDLPANTIDYYEP